MLAKSIRPVLVNESSSAAAADVDEECGVCNEAGVRAVVIKRGPKDPTELEIKEHYANHDRNGTWVA